MSSINPLRNSNVELLAEPDIDETVAPLPKQNEQRLRKPGEFAPSDATAASSSPSRAETSTTEQRSITSGRSFLLSRAAWTMGSYGASVSLRLASNIVLSRLLAPEIFGIMVVVNSIKVGIELLTDVGIEQNIVHSKDGLKSDFFNTAWTLQVLRGACLTTLFLCLAKLLSSFFGIDQRVFLIVSFAPLVNSLASTSIFGLVKNLEVKKRNVFELISEFLSFIIYVVLALVTPTVWALATGAVLSLGARSALSYFILHTRHRVTFYGPYVREILRFGKWIFVSSFVVYAATNLDRMYLGKMAPLGILGIYGLARTIAELPSTLAGRLSYQIVFPVIAISRTQSNAAIRGQLATTRWRFLLVASILMASGIAWSDWAVKIIYDPRYHQAGWMLFVLLIGAWFSTLSSLNEAILLGFGQPAYNGLANGARLAVIAAALPLGYWHYGLGGAIIAVGASEISRYVFVAMGQQRIRFSFWTQDGMATGLLTAMILAWIVLRHVLGLGEPWDNMLFHGARFASAAMYGRY